MFSRVPIAAAAMMALAVGVASPAQADFFTQQAIVDMASGQPAHSAPISPTILIETAGGRSFSNSYGVDGSGNLLVRAVGVIVINDLKTGPNGGNTFNGIFDPAAPGQSLVVGFALDGHTTGPGMATFTSGGAGIWVAPTNLNSDDASTWFQNLSSPLYQTALAPPTNIHVGTGDTLGGLNPGDIKYPTSIVNISSVNFGLNGGNAQGTLLFNETFDPNHLIDAIGLPPGANDALAAVFSLTLGTAAAASNLLNADTTGGGTAAQKQDAVNALAAHFGLSDLGGPNTAFATFGTGTATDYLPGQPGINSTDFSATQTTELYPGANVPIPEPSTFGLMAIGTAAIGLFAGFRSNRKS